MLVLKDVEAKYDNIKALKGVTLHVDYGEIVTIIGANGAGKTTTLNVISGIIRAHRGEILFENRSITDLRPEEIVSIGVIQAPEGRQIFGQLTVTENIMLGAYLRKDKIEIAADVKRVYELFPRLRERGKQLGGTLSGGEQQMLAIARSLMSRPKLLLLDEPSLGLSPIYVQQIFDVIIDINRSGATILLVEQNANMALNIAKRAYVLETGRVVREGDAQKLKNETDIRKIYLGG
jgi:branched-chain amino acid transport system ATP-binding protein